MAAPQAAEGNGLSSILEALKKAEQESIMDRGGTPSGPVALPKRSPYAPRKRRWWLPLGLMGAACIGVVLFWQFQRPETAPLEPAPVSPPASQARTRSSAPIPPPEESEPPAAPKEQTSPVMRADDPKTPQRLEDQAASSLQEQTPVPVVSAAQPEVPPAEKRVPRRPLPAVPEEEAPAQLVLPSPDDSVAAALDEDPPLRQESAGATPAVPPPAEESPKTYRSDPRIELQALVWAPEASARFVVINNRLIKEGGSTDGIMVVQINRDDVLLAEGTDRWYEKFKIR